MTLPKQIRLQSGLPQHVAATLAGVSPNTWKLFESNPDAVSAKVLGGCLLAVEKMRLIAQEKGRAA